MTKSTRKTRAAAAQPGTIAADKQIEIRYEPKGCCLSDDPVKRRREWGYVDPARFFPEDDLATMPLVVRNTALKSRRVLVWRSDDGSWWRRGGLLYIRQRGGRRAFEIVLFKGATENDYKSLRAEVDRVRTGRSGDHWKRIESDWADDFTFGWMFDSRPYGDPWVHEDSSRRVTACDEPLCSAKVHTKFDSHEIEHIDKVSRDGEVKYTIAVRKDVDDADKRGWYVNVSTDEFYGCPEDVTSFIVDLEWARQEAKRANEQDQGGEADVIKDRAA